MYVSGDIMNSADIFKTLFGILSIPKIDKSQAIDELLDECTSMFLKKLLLQKSATFIKDNNFLQTQPHTLHNIYPDMPEIF